MSAIEFALVAESRTDLGKGASRRLRHTGKVPAIVYGAHQEALPIMLSANELNKSLQHEAFYNHVLNLQLDGKTERVVLKDLQRHPYKPLILHVDLQRIREDEAIRMVVPLHFIHEDICVGVKVGGGHIAHHSVEVEIACLPKDLPEYISVDMTDVGLGQVLHLSELVLPQGVNIPLLAQGEEYNLPVVSVQKRGGETEEAATE
jgi:large subunit ribosomal protein L25